MTALNQIYKCKICGHIIEVLHTGNGTLVCCGQPMELMQEKSADIGMEKHVPVIEKTATGIKVKIGSIPHPMEDKHYIEWIQIFTDGKACRKFLKPGDKPEAEFDVKNITYDSDLQCLVITTGNDVKADNIIAREFCNVHGLWKTQ